MDFRCLKPLNPCFRSTNVSSKAMLDGKSSVTLYSTVHEYTLSIIYFILDSAIKTKLPVREK